MLVPHPRLLPIKVTFKASASVFSTRTLSVVYFGLASSATDIKLVHVAEESSTKRLPSCGTIPFSLYRIESCPRRKKERGRVRISTNRGHVTIMNHLADKCVYLPSVKTGSNIIAGIVECIFFLLLIRPTPVESKMTMNGDLLKVAKVGT